jgi:hypothetical protein
MFTKLLTRAVSIAALALVATSTLAHAENPAAAPPTLDAVPTDPVQQWTNYGFHITAPASMLPMLELLHQYHFDWELYSIQARPTPLVWATLAPGAYGSYVPAQNVVKLSTVLQNESVDLGTAFLAHELTHLTDDLNGQLGNMSGDACYAAETRAFVNEANFWQMLWGPQGKRTSDWLEQQENNKMFSFVGHSDFADLVLRTTASYVKECGS